MLLSKLNTFLSEVTERSVELNVSEDAPRLVAEPT